MCYTDSGDSEDRNADGGYDEAYHCGNNIAARHLTEVDWEYEISGAEEHAEQRSGDEKLLLQSQFFIFH